MIDVKPEILGTLKNNPALTTFLGGQRIYQLVAPNADEFPRITFFEMSNFGSQYADDTESASEILVQVDVWSKGSTSKIAPEVDRTMKQIGFKRTSTADLYEDDTKIFHKAMRYTTTREV